MPHILKVFSTMHPESYIALFIPTPTESHWLKKHLNISSTILLSPSRLFLGGLPEDKDSALKFLVVQTGMGPEAALRAARFAFQFFSIREAWVLGLAAATQKGYATGDVLVATRVGNSLLPKDQWIETTPSLQERVKGWLKDFPIPIHQGPLVTVKDVIASPEHKLKIGLEYHAIGLEMEAHPIAEQAKIHGVPFMELRWVLDPAEYPLPPTESFVEISGKVRPLRLLFSLLKQPSLIFKLFNLLAKVRKGRSVMNQFLQKWLESEKMPPSSLKREI